MVTGAWSSDFSSRAILCGERPLLHLQVPHGFLAFVFAPGYSIGLCDVPAKIHCGLDTAAVQVYPVSKDVLKLSVALVRTPEMENFQRIDV